MVYSPLSILVKPVWLQLNMQSRLAAVCLVRQEHILHLQHLLQPMFCMYAVCCKAFSTLC